MIKLIVINTNVEISPDVTDPVLREEMAKAKIRKELPETTAICDDISIFSWDEPSKDFPTWMAYADHGVKIKIPSFVDGHEAKYMRSIYPELNKPLVNDIWTDD